MIGRTPQKHLLGVVGPPPVCWCKKDILVVVRKV